MREPIDKLIADVNKTKQHLIQYFKRYGAHENFGQKQIRALKDKWHYLDLVYGDESERRMAALIHNLMVWASTYNGEETQDEELYYDDKPSRNWLDADEHRLGDPRGYPTDEDIDKYATDEEKTFLENWRKDFDPKKKTQLKVRKLHLKGEKKKKVEAESRKGYIPLYVKQKKILNKFVEDRIDDIINIGGGFFDVDKWPELYDEVAAVRETETLWSDINRYVSDRIMDYKYYEDIDKYATDDEKEFLKETKKMSGGEKLARHLDRKKQRDETATKRYEDKEKERKEKEKVEERIVDQSEHEAFERMMGGPKKAFRMLDLYKDCRTDDEFALRAHRQGYSLKQIAKLLSLQESKQLTEAKNTKGKTRKVDDPYEIYQGHGALQDWEWRVLKHWKAPENEKDDPYARVFCAVKSPMTYGDWEYGDVYCREIPGYKYEDEPKEHWETFPDPENPKKSYSVLKKDPLGFGKAINSDRIKNMSPEEIDMISKMFK